MKITKFNMIVGVGIVLLIAVIPLFQPSNDSPQIPLSQAISDVNNGKVSMVIQNGDDLRIVYYTGSPIEVSSKFDSDKSLIELGLNSSKTELIVESETNRSPKSVILSILPVAVIGAVVFFMVAMLRHNINSNKNNKSLWTFVILLGGLVIGPLVYYFAVYKKATQ